MSVLPALKPKLDGETREAAVAIESDGLNLAGLAIPFNQPTRIRDQDGEYHEVFRYGAFAESIRNRQVLPVLFQHGLDLRTGSTPIGVTSSLTEAPEGLFIEGRLFDNPLTQPIRDAVNGGAIAGLSIRFSTPPGGDSWTRAAGRLPIRTVTRARVSEVSLVWNPAYSGTSVGLRDHQRVARHRQMVAAGILKAPTPAAAVRNAAFEARRRHWAMQAAGVIR